MNYRYDKDGELILDNKKISPQDKRFLRIWGYIVLIFFFLLGFLIGKFVLR